MSANSSQSVHDPGAPSVVRESPVLQSSTRADELRLRYFPEAAAGGFTRVDGTVEFYQRLNALLRPDMQVLDLGAGRAEWAHDPVIYRRQLRTLRGKVARVIGADVDPAVLDNPMVDAAVQLHPQQPLPFEAASFDLIVADWVFEHIAAPARFCAEIDRLLQPGGWICARTTNRFGYVALLASLIPNRWHARVVGRVQHQRQAIDVFPTRYRMNSIARLRKLFPADSYELHAYCTSAEPAYAGSSRALWAAAMISHRALPGCLQNSIFLFARKR